MKKAIAMVILILLVFSIGLMGKSKEGKQFEDAVTGKNVSEWAPEKNIITANPIGLAFGYFNANYEKALSRDNGLGFSAGFNFYGAGGWSWVGANVGASYNWYFQHHALNGWFAGPMANISFLSITYDFPGYAKETGTSFGISLGGHGGYRWIWDSGFVLDLSLGLSFGMASAVSFNGTAAPVGGFGFGPGINLGYAW